MHALRWINETLVKAKPAFHRKTFLKPLHRSTEFCGACHKVHIPEELNRYRWLRGQNHYDSFLLSGVSGHGIRSFYYPDAAEKNCNGCHMPTLASDDFGARQFDETGELKVHDHQFPSANTGVPHMLGLPQTVIDAHRDFLRDSLRVDVFGIKAGGSVDGALTAPLRPELPKLEPGGTYLVETVLRTLTLGHLFTQGTADSNEIWLDVRVTTGGRVIGRSGAMDEGDGSVDPWSHFVNAWVLDREGRRIERRNPEDVFTTLYDNQIPPGAADVVHFRLTVPEWVTEPVEFEVGLIYRKFDTTFMRHVQGDRFLTNDLPVTRIAGDRVVFPVGGAKAPEQAVPKAPEWERWNDYGIGLFRKRGTGELRQAETAFLEVEALGEPRGSLNAARVYLREGRLEEAAAALGRAGAAGPPAYPWSVAYFTAVLNRENGFLDEAIDGYRALIDTRFNEARARRFDFSRDYRLLHVLEADREPHEVLGHAARPERGSRQRRRRFSSVPGWSEGRTARRGGLRSSARRNSCTCARSSWTRRTQMPTGGSPRSIRAWVAPTKPGATGRFTPVTRPTIMRGIARWPRPGGRIRQRIMPRRPSSSTICSARGPTACRTGRPGPLSTDESVRPP